MAASKKTKKSKITLTTSHRKAKRPGNLSRRGSNYTCSVCDEVGHNARRHGGEKAVPKTSVKKAATKTAGKKKMRRALTLLKTMSKKDLPAMRNLAKKKANRVPLRMARPSDEEE